MTPAMLMLERALDHRTLARAEVLQAVSYPTFQVTAAGRGKGASAGREAWGPSVSTHGQRGGHARR